jgi:endonuclease G, mitochondrial
VVDPDFGLGPTTIVTRDGYVLEHSSADKIPLWVAELVEQSQLTGAAKRRDTFAPDPLLKQGTRAELSDCKRSGFDRGHQAPAGNQTVDQRLKNETFFLSNMAPQKPQLNQQIWAALEDRTREWAKEAGAVHMVTGGLFYDAAEEDPNTADGLINFLTIGKGVAVPTHFYKIVVRRDGGQTRAIAFVAENRGYPKPFDLASLITSIDWVEERAGIDFMPDLPDAEQTQLEAQPSAMW